MKRILLIFFIIILFLAFINNYNNNPKIIINRLLNKDNDINISRLRYRINLVGIVPIGEAAIEMEKAQVYLGKQVYQLTATARSLDIFSKFFSSYAILNSYIDMQKFNPMLFKQRLVVKGRKDIEKEIIYDQQQGIMLAAGIRRKILPNTQDPLSALFNVRRSDFNVVREFEMNINTSQKNYILKGVAHLRDIKIKNKVHKTIILKAEIMRRDKNPYHKSTISMVLLKERNNIPILINAFAGGILINARLIDFR